MSARKIITTSPTIVVSYKVFDVFAPPPLNSISGTLVPNFLRHNRRQRRVTIEVHQVGPDDARYEEAVVRVLEPVDKGTRREARQRSKQRKKDAQNPDDEASIGSNDSTVAPAAFADDGTAALEMKGWKAKYRFPVQLVTIKGTHGKTGVVVHINMGKMQQTRELFFDTESDAEAFEDTIAKEHELEVQRKDAKLKSTLKGIELPREKITFLIEIVSAWDIPAGDFRSSDPYVLCSLNGKEVHRTKYISKTLDPIWTLKTNSLFLLTVDPKELFLSDGLLCIIYDFDKVGKNERLGAITVEPKTLFEATGDRLEYKLGPPPGKTKEVPGYMAIRCRSASDYDIKFLEDYQKSRETGLLGLKKKGQEILAEAKSAGSVGALQSYYKRQSKTIKEGDKEVKVYKIRPGPDPARPEGTKWMSKEAIENECARESKSWVDAGSGSLGRVFVEILGCDGLPNLDTGGRNKTDAFVSVVYEDYVAMTDIVDDCLSPRWLPWTKRAFIFHMMHSSSQLFLGVFDYDQGVNPTDKHDLIGRVSVDLSNLRKNTVYTLKYNIYTTARMSERKKKGTITVRVRLEIDDERKLLLSNLEPPPQIYVNVKKRKDFKVLRYTTQGKYDMTQYSMNYINSYIEELLALQHTLFYLKDASYALLLWRGTYDVTLFGKFFEVPVHSITAFCAAVLMVEHPQLIPSMFFGSIAWLLLAVMTYRQDLPDLWSRCKGFPELINVLVTGSSPVKPPTIAPMENYDAAQKFLIEWQDRVKKSEEEAALAYEESLKAQEELQAEMEDFDAADTDISTKSRGISIDPFKPILFPVQQNLAMVCRYIRHIKYVIFWEECYISFWIALGCLLLSFIFLFIPWLFLIKWTSRLLVWATFGPWMKLVDIYYVQKVKPLTEEELEEKRRKEREDRKASSATQKGEARIKKENAVKLKQMKKHMFGRFICTVPVLKEERYRDIPLPDSTAKPYQPKALPLSEVAMAEAGYHRKRVSGQQLVGDMIPKAVTDGFTEAPIGQATARPNLVDKSGPGGGGYNESTMSAYIKIASIAILAGILTWFLVPIMSSATEQLVTWYVKHQVDDDYVVVDDSIMDPDVIVEL